MDIHDAALIGRPTKAPVHAARLPASFALVATERAHDGVRLTYAKLRASHPVLTKLIESCSKSG